MTYGTLILPPARRMQIPQRIKFGFQTHIQLHIQDDESSYKGHKVAKQV